MAWLNVVIAGAAGQGVQSAAAIFGRLLLRQGLHVFTSQDYQSRVRGGHNFMSLRIADHPVGAAVRQIDYLVALNDESLDIHLPNLVPDGLALCMADNRGDRADPRLRALPLDVGPDAARHPRYNGVKLLAMLARTIGFSVDDFVAAVRVHFEKRLAPDVLDLNLAAIHAAADLVAPADVHELPFRLDPGAARMYLDGHQALALGMLAGGVGVYVGYPMSPSTSVLSTLGSYGAEFGVAVEQVEDEVAALNVVCGAAFMGARAATGSSGAGIALMSEAIGLAGITETPAVVVLAQRPGPSTGMATRTEQADLLMVVHASQGEFPRAVVAPVDATDAFHFGAEAFNLAERWQVPVFIMTDQVLADSQQTVADFDLARVAIDRGAIAPEPDAPAVLPRYRDTESGVSPRAFPTLSKWIVQADSHEHTEVGHLSDNQENRVRQHGKRMRKLAGIAAEFDGPEIVGDPDGTLFLVWGSTAGPAREAVERLHAAGHRVGVAIFRHLYPMNRDKVRAALAAASARYSLEVNATGQLGKLVLLETGLPTAGHLGKIDGRVFTVKEIEALMASVLGGAS